MTNEAANLIDKWGYMLPIDWRAKFTVDVLAVIAAERAEAARCADIASAEMRREGEDG